MQTLGQNSANDYESGNGNARLKCDTLPATMTPTLQISSGYVIR